MKLFQVLWVAAIFISSLYLNAQGPPITADKPLMLGANGKVVKTLTEWRQTNDGAFIKMPLMFHYLPTANTLVGIHLPMIVSQPHAENDSIQGVALGDIELLAKYQFYRKDGKGKTFRLVIKAVETLPTGKHIAYNDISTGVFQSYLGLVAGYESIKLGVSNEIGYRFIPDNENDELRYKLGFGLPLLKPTYPPKQVNLYFEYQSSWFVETQDYLMLFAQGIQYVKNQWTYETSIQFPVIQHVAPEHRRDFSLYIGTRYIF